MQGSQLLWKSNVLLCTMDIRLIIRIEGRELQKDWWFVPNGKIDKDITHGLDWLGIVYTKDRSGIFFELSVSKWVWHEMAEALGHQRQKWGLIDYPKLRNLNDQELTEILLFCNWDYIIEENTAVFR
jgi:hypothetical protein